jgi:hypothetical protein
MGTLAGALRLLTAALTNLADTTSDPALMLSFLRDLGWSLDQVPAPIATIGAPAQALAALWNTISDDELTAAQLTQLSTALQSLWNALLALEAMADPPGLAGAGFATDLARTIVDYWLLDALERDANFTLPLLELIGLVEIRYVDDALPRQAYISRRIIWDRVPALLSDPGAGFRARFGWGTASFAASEALSRIRALLVALRWSAVLREADPNELAVAGASADDAILGVDLQLLRTNDDTGLIDAGVRFLPLAPTTGLPGLAIVPYVAPGLGVTFPLDDHVTVSVDGTFDLSGGVALSWLPDRGISLITDFTGNSGVTRTTGGATVTLAIDDPAKPDKTLIDALGVTLTARTAQGVAKIALDPAPEFAIEAEIKDGMVRWDASQLPGVLGQLFSGRTFEVPAALAIGWSSVRGFYFRGGTALEAVIPAAVQLGPLQLSGVRVSAAQVSNGAALTLGLDGKFTAGPVVVGWQRLGVRVAASRGSTMPIDLSIDASLPDLISFAVSSSLLTGSGSLQRVDADHFTGSLALAAFGVTVGAVAAITRAPSGTSIAAVLSARWPGIPIGLGFELDGMTGVLGIDRSVDLDVLRGQLRTGGVAQLLGGRGDPATTLAALAQVFPVAAGRTVIGLGPSIGWGSPRVLQGDLAVLLELPAPIRIDLLASMQLGLPSLDHRIVDIRIDALGVVDFDRGTLALDASLHDSKLAGYALTGDMALRLGWGDAPEFLLSIGGFHPHFTPPPGFPSLRRLALTAGDNPQLRLSAYLALTSNTAQVGAEVDLTASGDGFKIAAQVGFDALFQFVPFAFEVEITARASISWHSVHLLGVDLDFTLSGPHPWHAKGDASFGVLWWDVSVGFDTTWGDATPAPLPPPPSIANALTDALSQPTAWTSELPADEPAWVTFASPANTPPVGPTSTIVVHPFAALVVRERAVPLGYLISQFGNVPLATTQQLDLTAVRIGSTTVSTTPVTDSFAPGQFTQLTADQRLVAPSFETLQSGARIAAGEARIGATARSSMDVDTEVVDPLAPPPVMTVVVVPPVITVLAPIVRPPLPRPAPPRRGPVLSPLAFVLASLEDLSMTAAGAAIAGGNTTYGVLREALAAHVATTGVAPQLQIVPRAQASNRHAHVVVVSQDEHMRNIDFVDTITGRAMTRAEFVDAIRAGQYPDYYVRSINGLSTPVSKPNATTDDNLG